MGEVVGSIVPHWYDVANSLRALADEIEDGLYGEVYALATILENADQDRQTWCCGPGSSADVSMLLHGHAFLMYADGV